MHPILCPYRPMLFAKDWAQANWWPSSKKILMAWLSFWVSPLANPWYAMSNNGKCPLPYTKGIAIIIIYLNWYALSSQGWFSDVIEKHLEKLWKFFPLLRSRIHPSWIMSTSMQQNDGTSWSFLWKTWCDVKFQHSIVFHKVIKFTNNQHFGKVYQVHNNSILSKKQAAQLKQPNE